MVFVYHRPEFAKEARKGHINSPVHPRLTATTYFCSCVLNIHNWKEELFALDYHSRCLVQRGRGAVAGQGSSYGSPEGEGNKRRREGGGGERGRGGEGKEVGVYVRRLSPLPLIPSGFQLMRPTYLSEGFGELY